MLTISYHGGWHDVGGFSTLCGTFDKASRRYLSRLLD